MNTKSGDRQDSDRIIKTFTNQYPGHELFHESLIKKVGVFYFMTKFGGERFLWILSELQSNIDTRFSGEQLSLNGYEVLKCAVNRQNAEILREHYPFTKPVLSGKQNAYGLGDRLGNAGVAHLKAVRKTSFKPVLAQRELTRTNRTAEEVLDAASWAVFQEGYREGFGADGDHLKNTDDIF